MTTVTLARTIEPARSSPRRARRPRRGGGRWLILAMTVLVVGSMLIVGLAARRAIDGAAPLADPSDTSAGPGVRVVLAEPLDRPVIAVPEPEVAPVPAPVPSPTALVTATPPAARIVDAPELTPPQMAAPAARPPEPLSSPADLAEDAAAAGLTGRASLSTTEDRP